MVFSFETQFVRERLAQDLLEAVRAFAEASNVRAATREREEV